MTTQADATPAALVQAFLEALPDILFVLDEDFLHLGVYTSQTHLLYRQADQIRGKTIREIHPPERARLFEDLVRQTIETGTPQQIEYELDVPAGQRWFEGSCAPFQPDDSGKRAAVFVARDVTARKLAELELKRSNADLEHFAAIASHDLREPLRSITLYLELLEASGSTLSDEGRDLLHSATESATRLQTQITDLLAYSRAAHRPLSVTLVDVEQVLEDVLSDLRSTIDEAGAEIVVGPLAPLRADRQQLQQLLRNLLGNALKFRGETAPRVHVELVEREGAAVLTVRDDGIGIPKAAQQRIFEAFQRLHGNDRYLGSGIGLAICRRIMQRHEGSIWVESAEGQGAAFHCAFPV